MQNMNQDLVSPECFLSKTDLNNINNLLKLDFPTATFAIISLFWLKRLKKWKSLKSGSREIQLKLFIEIVKIYPRGVLDILHQGLFKSWYIFCISLFGMCVVSYDAMHYYFFFKVTQNWQNSCSEETYPYVTHLDFCFHSLIMLFWMSLL